MFPELKNASLFVQVHKEGKSLLRTNGGDGGILKREQFGQEGGAEQGGETAHALGPVKKKKGGKHEFFWVTVREKN